MKILHIDDSNLSLKMLKSSLALFFKNADITSIKPDKYFEYENKLNDFDIIIVDLTMPIISGFEIIEKLKKDKINAFIVVYSANVQKTVKEKLKVNMFIEKPVTEEQIILLKRKYELWKEKK
ncbi:hypothetical protein JCM30566_08970 [Marinitoga arctica]